LRNQPSAPPPYCYTAVEQVKAGQKADGTWGIDGKAVVIWTTMAFLQARRPWEEGGKRRMAPATFEGKYCLF